MKIPFINTLWNLASPQHIITVIKLSGQRSFPPPIYENTLLVHKKVRTPFNKLVGQPRHAASSYIYIENIPQSLSWASIRKNQFPSSLSLSPSLPPSFSSFSKFFFFFSFFGLNLIIWFLFHQV